MTSSSTRPQTSQPPKARSEGALQPGHKPSRLKADWLKSPAVTRVFTALNQEGFEARVVGGAVRNSLLGRPVSDIDFATTAPPDDTIRLAQAAGFKTIATGIEHGTVTLVIKSPGAPPASFEVTTLRRDVDTDGRHAKVAFSQDWQADASRRDFTINALYVDAEGRIYDPVGGLDDILHKRVRFIGDPEQRIAEDYLRILRFFRFFAEYAPPESVPDTEALEAIVRGRGGLARLSGERIRQEMLKLLIAPQALSALSAMRDYGILHRICGVTRLGIFRKMQAAEALLSLSPDPLRRLAALAVTVAEDAKRLATRWRLSNAGRDRLLQMAASQPQIHQDMKELDAKIALYRLGVDNYRDRLLMACAHADPNYQPGRWIWLYELPDRWPIPQFPLKGSDIMALGVPEGPQISFWLKKIETYWIKRNFEPSPRHLRRAAKQLIRAASS